MTGEESFEVAVIGAGPYGLAAAAHLRAAGVAPHVFGKVMEFWQRQMPRGMYLRSSWRASHIADPLKTMTLDEYEKAQRVELPRPVPLERFVDYGLWFQRQAVPEVDERRVTSVEPDGPRFRLTLDDGGPMLARRVVVAAGISPFAQRPPEFDGMPAALVSHSSEHSDLGRFAGLRVIVVGGGQSAIESAALLAECGATVEVLIREPYLRWLARSNTLHSKSARLKSLLYAPSDVGPAGLSWLVALPDLFRLLPHTMQDPIAYRCIRPAAASWLQPRVKDVRITMERKVESAQASEGGVALQLDDGSTRLADHVLLATGFRVDVRRYPFLGPRVLQGLRCVGGYPVLSAGFESSVPGLHFLGAPAAWSFGPVMRFVAGTEYATPALARKIRAGQR